MKSLYTILVLCCLTTLLNAQDIDLEQFASGFSNPVDIVNAGDERLFIVERAGRIKIIDGAGNVQSTLFLNITSDVNASPNERGLLGLEFHPDYANNGYFFVNYTDNNGDTRVSRFSVSSTDPNVADPNSEVLIMEIAQPYWNHNAGDLAFGPDGYLYIGSGDGGDGGDPGNRAQNPQNLLGKMLRIDVDNGTPYSIPADNPFVGNADVLDEIWAIGLRNPWRYSFDRETGDLWMGDVGQGQWEEIDMEPANSGGGFNYGWRCYEGDAAFNTNGCASASEYQGPVLDYNHSGFTHCSVTGGFVYRGCAYPDLIGHYIYADYCSGRFWSINPDGNGGWNDQEVGSFPGYDISTFGEDMNGELYVARLSQGRIYKITTDAAVSIDIEQVGDVLTGPEGYASYQWYLNGDPVADANTNSIDITESGTYTLEVTNASGCLFTSADFVGTVDVENIATLDAFDISPIPFSEVLTLSFDTNAPTALQIQLLNIEGKVIYSKEVNISGQENVSIRPGDIAAGVYFVQLNSEEGSLARRVVKQGK